MRILMIVCLLLCATPVWGMTPCRPGPPALRLWPNYMTKKIPPHAQFFFLRTGHALPHIWLEERGGRKVPTKLSHQKAGHLSILRPLKPLQVGKAYRLRLRPDVPMFPRRSLSSYYLYNFTVSRAAKASPRLPRWKVSISPYLPGSRDMRSLRRAGRDGLLRFSRRPPQIAVLLVEGKFLRKGKVLASWSMATMFSKQIHFASGSFERCRGWGPSLPVGPRKGNYLLRVTPFYTHGKAGKRVRISGRIRTRN